jgi:CRP-like cAMP-binding protein
VRARDDSFLARITETERQALHSIATLRDYPPDAVLCRQGERPEQVFVIDRGWVKVTCLSDDGKETVVAVRGEGDIVGEGAAVGRSGREASVTAIGPMRAMVIPGTRFVTLVDRHHGLWRILTGILLERIDQAHRLRANATADGARRFARLLVHLCEDFGIEGQGAAVSIPIPLSQGELGSWVGISRETVVRALVKWRRQGLLITSRREITVTNLPRLRREAGIDDAALLQRLVSTVDAGSLTPALDSDCPRAQHCVLFAVDIAGFTAPDKDDDVQLSLRSTLYDLLTQAFEKSEISWNECLHEDRGDGVLVIIPARMPSVAVIDPLLHRLRAGLRYHNRLASEVAAIRLRVAVHIGEVHYDGHGLAGTAVNHLFRLLEAPALKRALSGSASELVLLASDYFYDSVIRQAPRLLDPAEFRPAIAEVKNTRARGWLYVPAAAAPPGECGGRV